MTTFDVAVVGCGVAGAAAAIALASAGSSVVALGRAPAAGCRTVEVLGPEVASMLVHLGVWQTFLESGPEPVHGIWSAWGHSQVVAKDFVMSPHGPAWRVDRPRFDEMLLTAARKKGAEVVQGLGRVVARRQGCGWRITAVRKDLRLAFDSRFVVDATGRSAAVARSDGASWMARDRLVALIGLLEATHVSPPVADDVLLVESVPRGWWYSAALPSGELVATFLTDADLTRTGARPASASWVEALAASQLTASRAAGLSRSAFHVRPAGTGRLDRASGPGWVAVGDAASTIDPLSGIGVAKALRSSILAAAAVGEVLAGDDRAFATYAERERAEFEASLRIGAAYYRSEERWPESSFWRRRNSHREEVSHGKRSSRG